MLKPKCRLAIPVKKASWAPGYGLRKLPSPSNSASFAPLLRLCGLSKSIPDGLLVHHHIITRGLEQDEFLGSLLVQMYDSFGNSVDALHVFSRLHHRNVCSWNFIIRAHAQQGQFLHVFELFYRMQQEAVMPNRVTIVCILSACVSQEALIEGTRMHARIIESDLEIDVVLGTALVNMYGKCGSLNEAKRTFETMPERNVVSWTAMIGGYSQLVQGKEAFLLYRQMQEEGVLPNKITFINLLAACTNNTVLVEGKQIHVGILNSTIELDVVLGTALVSMYGKCGSLEDSWIIFQTMPERNVVSWNAMIAIYRDYGQGKEAVQLFKKMLLEGVMPDKVTFLYLLSACASTPLIAEGKLIHAATLNSGHWENALLGNAAIDMYGKCGSLEDALTIFHNLADQDVFSWTAMIGVCSEHGQTNEALQFFEQMHVVGVAPNRVTYISVLTACASQKALTEGKKMHILMLHNRVERDVVVENALLSMYGKCNSLEDAQRIFYEMLARDIVSWNIMIALHIELGQHEESLGLIAEMQREGISPDTVTFVSILGACGNMAALAEGEKIHSFILDGGFESDTIVTNALVTMYGKCGNLEKAWNIFDKLSGKNVISWSAMIAVYAQHGHGKQALQLFDQMKQSGICPNEVTFVNVLVACSHCGLVKEGLVCFHFMKSFYGISPALEHYVCMVDLLGRAGQLDDAEYLINSMPLQANMVAFMALLGACRYQPDVERGKRAAKRVCELDQENTAPYAVLSTIYVAAGTGDAATKELLM